VTKAETHPLGQDLNDCTGCAACAAACPKDCITIQPDDEGFPHPHIDLAICINCDLCRQVCPVSRKTGLAQTPPKADEPAKTHRPEVFAAWHLDDAIRLASSSGGVFTALAENILARGGVVVGAAYDENMVVRHVIVDTPADLPSLRGSKYVQSQISPALHRQIRDLLKQGRPVLFSGTPCQVAGLRSFLRQPSEALFCCDLICHGVPSPLLFERYVQHSQAGGGGTIANVSFRDKTNGWKRYTIRHTLPDGQFRVTPWFDDSYMLAFANDYALRPACYACHFTTVARQGDITIADFWGVANKYPQYDQDDKGTSLILVNTEKGAAWLDACCEKLFLGKADLDTAIAGNPMLVRPTSRPKQRDTFYRNLNVLSFPTFVRKYRLCQPTRFRRLSSWGKRTLLAMCRKVMGS
jgi:coenzyme F420-reducing hydrogenase beta subunit